uniref:Uncharacterized protein n=1 Tax=Siphoviridae sp. ctdHi7 TaxID=2825577 RepID=A0A8S5U1W8_9CAUD|nr:MAG TPA: hypothetical protein [Siphoviridae sp. ctdHi7]
MTCQYGVWYNVNCKITDTAARRKPGGYIFYLAMPRIGTIQTKGGAYLWRYAKLK